MTPPGDHTARYTFPRSRRLKRQRFIRPLFDRTRDDVQVVRAGAVVIRYRIVPANADDPPLQIGFATGRHLRTKPVRNRIKRVMREVFRVHQHALVDLFADRPDMLTLMVLYRGRRAGAEAVVAREMPRLLARIEHSLASDAEAATSGDA